MLQHFCMVMFDISILTGVFVLFYYKPNDCKTDEWHKFDLYVTYTNNGYVIANFFVIFIVNKLATK